jgi:hypothetical protein
MVAELGRPIYSCRDSSLKFIFCTIFVREKFPKALNKKLSYYVAGGLMIQWPICYLKYRPKKTLTHILLEILP